jgi:hypothetical protein
MNMMPAIFRKTCSVALTGLLLAGAPLAADAADHPAPKYKFRLPPTAVLHYSIKASLSGIPVEGSARVSWKTDGRQYTMTSEARAMLVGKILDTGSEGGIDAYGLAPLRYTEKRFRKDATATTFDRQAQVIRFSASDNTYPIEGGEQDRAGVIWQLVSVARAAQSKFKPGSSWRFFVAGQRDADPWTFTVTGREKISTPLGTLNALHVVKTPPPDSKEQRLDIWLAPQREWYPVQLRFSDSGDSDYIEQTLQSIEPGKP